MNVHSKAVASIESADDEKFGPNGGFTAILSTPSLDRDGDRLGRTEWVEPLPDRLPLDVDHGMSVADTIGSFHPYFEGDTLMMDAYFSSLPRAQEVRTLVKEGHIDSVSVAFMTDKSKKDGQANRELLNCGVVAIPSNRDAKILASKAFDALQDASKVLTLEEIQTIPWESEVKGLSALAIKALQEVFASEDFNRAGSLHIESENIVGIDTSGDDKLPSAEGVPLAEYFGSLFKGVFESAIQSKVESLIHTKGAGNGDVALLQAIHDASIHLGAMCMQLTQEESQEDSGGAAKGVHGNTGGPISKEQFDTALKELTSPAEAPAEAATDEVPADEAAVEAADVAEKVRELNIALFDAEFGISESA